MRRCKCCAAGCWSRCLADRPVACCGRPCGGIGGVWRACLIESMGRCAGCIKGVGSTRAAEQQSTLDLRAMGCLGSCGRCIDRSHMRGATRGLAPSQQRQRGRTGPVACGVLAAKSPPRVPIRSRRRSRGTPDVMGLQGLAAGRSSQRLGSSDGKGSKPHAHVHAMMDDGSPACVHSQESYPTQLPQPHHTVNQA